jgi:hypothetical protein
MAILEAKNRLESADYDPTCYFSTSSSEHSNLARWWVEQCLQYHGACPRPHRTFAPKRLIRIYQSNGTTSARLETQTVNTQEAEKYCTLSHCWGGIADMLLLTSGTLLEWEERLPLGQLAETFQDAIHFVAGMGMRYLWIDCLCILQDSIVDWVEQSSLMGKIYENAACNIVAASSENPHQGLFKSRNPFLTSECRVTGTHHDGLYVGRREAETSAFGYESVTSSAIHTRGWTFQECVLCPRLLYFTSHGLFWRCRTGRATEHRLHGFGQASSRSESYKPIFPESLPTSASPLLTWWDHDSQGSNMQVFNAVMEAGVSPGMESPQNWRKMEEFHVAWFNLLEDYSRRLLTREEDKLVALAGIADRIRETCGLSYVAGLWKSTILLDLLWFCYRGQRRRPPKYRAPSWSWASVDGEITSFVHMGAAHVGYLRENMESAEPMCHVTSSNVGTEEADTYQTGRVHDARLDMTGVIRDAQLGYLKDYPENGRFSLKWNGKASTSWNSWGHESIPIEASALVFHEQSPIGHFFADDSATLGDCIREDVALMPILKWTTATQSLDGIHRPEKSVCVYGLALKLQDHTYQRVGLFQVVCLRKADLEWFKGSQQSFQIQ